MQSSRPASSSRRRRSLSAALVGVGVSLLALGGCTPSGTFVRPQALAAECPQTDRPPETLRVVSYNMHGGVSSSLDEIGDVLEAFDADLVALQEVDRGVERSGRVNQDEVLAERLGYQNIFAAGRKRGGGDFGVALLSRLPIVRAERVELEAPLSSQPRAAIDATVCLGGEEVRVVAVHADVFPWSTQAAARVLSALTEDTVGAGAGVILAGDFNVSPESEAVRVLEDAGFVDVVSRFDSGPSFNGFPPRRLDYIFADGALAEQAGAAGIHRTEKSDHFPLYTDFGVDTGAGALAAEGRAPPPDSVAAAP